MRTSSDVLVELRFNLDPGVAVAKLASAVGEAGIAGERRQAGNYPQPGRAIVQGVGAAGAGRGR